MLPLIIDVSAFLKRSCFIINICVVRLKVPKEKKQQAAFLQLHLRAVNEYRAKQLQDLKEGDGSGTSGSVAYQQSAYYLFSVDYVNGLSGTPGVHVALRIRCSCWVRFRMRHVYGVLAWLNRQNIQIKIIGIEH
jgi:hypothetical protein